MKPTDRAAMCGHMMTALVESVRRYEKEGHGTPYRNAGYATPKNSQANKTAIKRQITSLRQSLLALEGEI